MTNMRYRSLHFFLALIKSAQEKDTHQHSTAHDITAKKGEFNQIYESFVKDAKIHFAVKLLLFLKRKTEYHHYDDGGSVLDNEWDQILFGFLWDFYRTQVYLGSDL